MPRGDVGFLHVGVNEVMATLFCGETIRDAADATSLLILVEIDLDLGVPPKRRLVPHRDVDMAGALAVYVDVPI
jgi:hypothetical protein